VWWIAGVIVVAVVVAAVAVALVVVRRRQQRQTALLRRKFGPEYDRAVRSAGGRRQGEAELEERLRRHRRLQLGPASDGAAYVNEWREVEGQFDDAPLAAVARAEALVITVLADRGYALESFEERSADLSVDYPEAVEHYRRAHAAYREADDGKASREDLYEAMQHYRALLEELTDGDEFAVPAAGEPERESVRERPPSEELPTP